MAMARDRADYVAVGRISGLHGIQGWIKVFSYTRPRENVLQYSPWWIRLDQKWQAVARIDSKIQGNGIIAQMEGYQDRTAAQGLVGADIAVRRCQLPGLEHGEFYWADLIGLQVVSPQVGVLGTVSQVMETGANDVLIVHGQREYLIPFIQGVYILDIDRVKGCIEVDWGADF
jgi:16S rRNA processing protein RimM